MRKIAPQQLFIVLFAEWYIVNSVKVKHLKCVSNSLLCNQLHFIIIIIIIIIDDAKNQK